MEEAGTAGRSKEVLGPEKILTPGEPEQLKARVNRSQGIPIGEETILGILNLCQELDLPYLLRVAGWGNDSVNSCQPVE